MYASPTRLIMSAQNKSLTVQQFKAVQDKVEDPSSVPAPIQPDQCTIGVMFNPADRAVAMYLSVQVLGNVLHQITQWTIQNQIIVTCMSTSGCHKQPLVRVTW